jgi:hypothetical protein
MLSPRPLTALRLALAFLLAAVVAHATGVFGDGSSTLKSPWPLLLTIPAFLGVPILLAAVAFGGLFYFACRRVDSDRSSLSKRTPIILALASIACAAYSYVSWSAGVEFQGKYFVYACALINTLTVLGLLSIWAMNRWKAAPYSAIAFYFALFAWLGTYAFPYIGEGT